MPVRSRLVHQPLALHDAKAVLLVNGHKSKSCKSDILLDQSVRADDQLCFAGLDAFERGLLFGALQAADQQFDTVARFAQNPPGRKEVLNGENFRGRHERRLRPVFDGDHRSLQGNDGLSAADIALQQAIHRRRLFQVCNNFCEDTFLRLCRFERENAFQSFADAVFAHAKGDGVFLARGPAVQAQAELVQKKLLEDEPLLRGRAKSVHGVERFRWLGKMCVNEGFAARGIVQAAAQTFRQNIRHPGIDELHCSVHRAPNLLGAERPDRFVNRHDAPHFRRIDLIAVQQLDLWIDHLQARGPQPVDFHLAVQNQELAGFQTAFEITAMKKFARQQAARFVLHKQVVNSVAAKAHGSNGLAAHHPRANGVCAVRLNVLHL